VREVVAGLSRDNGILNIIDDSEQLLWPDAASVSVLVNISPMALSQWRSYG
jgi:hypothetical protein